MASRRHRRVGDGGGDVPVRAATAGRVDGGGARRHGERVGVRRLRRGRGVRAGHRGGAHRATPVAALRGQRRRRVRGRPDVRGNHRRLRRARFASDVSGAGRDRRRHRNAPAGGGRDRDIASEHRPDRPQAGRPGRCRRRIARLRPVPTPPSPTTRAACSPPAAAKSSPTGPTGSAAARAWTSSSPALRPGPACSCSGPSTSPPRSPGRVFPRLPRHGVRCPTGVRDLGPLSDGRRGGRRVAASLPRGAGGRGRDRRPHRDLRAHPRPEVRRPAARGGAAPARGRLCRGDGVAADP